MACPLCLPTSPAIWKYNLWGHIQDAHPTVNVNLYWEKFFISETEDILLKAVMLAKPRVSKKQRCQKNGLQISEMHSTRMLLK